MTVMEKAYFGVGCFHFGIKKKAPLIFKIDEWNFELEKFLKSIPTVSEISITKPELEEDVEFAEGESIPKLDKLDCFPQSDYSSMRVEFKIYIPFRIQEEILQNDIVATATENFKVVIVYPFYLPVAFVFPLNTTEEPDPSQSVQLVRVILEKENEKSNYIEFEYVGPSPYHADFHIYAKEETYFNDKINIGSTTKNKLGYAEVKFFYNTGFYSNAMDAFDDIEYRLADELSIFYEIVQKTNYINEKWMMVQDSVKEMVDDFSKRSWFKNRIYSGKDLDNSLIALSHFKMDEIYIVNELKEIVDKRYTKDHGFVKELTYEEINSIKKFPSSEVGELLGLFENRRMKRIEALIVLLAAILGGSFGSLLTILFSGKSLYVECQHIVDKNMCHQLVDKIVL